MSEKRNIFRALVNERLTAAAEEIFALFERTIAEYEEELCRSKEENERKQQLLDSVTATKLTQSTEVQIKSPDEEEVDQVLDYENKEAARIKEEYEETIIKKEEEQLQDFTFYSGKSEDEEQTDNDEDWEAPCSSSFQHTETEADLDYYNQVYMQALDTNTTDHNSKRKSANSTLKQHKCPECEEEFAGKQDLQNHMLVHAGEKPISCPVCSRSFTRNGSLKLHMAMHMREKPFSCPVCNRGFTQKGNLRSHMAQHTGEKPFSCTECDARFPIKRTLLRHMKLHTGERPYSCPYCEKSFTRKEHVRLHMSIHTGQTTPKKRRIVPTRTVERESYDNSTDSNGPVFYANSSKE